MHVHVHVHVRRLQLGELDGSLLAAPLFGGVVSLLLLRHRLLKGWLSSDSALASTSARALTRTLAPALGRSDGALPLRRTLCKGA